jgi:Transmembrane protein 26
MTLKVPKSRIFQNAARSVHSRNGFTHTGSVIRRVEDRIQVNYDHVFIFYFAQVRNDRILCMLILSLWSWSLMQFTLVLTATKERKDRTGLLPSRQKSKNPIVPTDSCCTPDVYGIIISIMMQDAPFLVLRMLLIFKYGVLSYTNMFFTCKNTLVCMLLTYRLSVIQLERCNERYHLFGAARRRENSSVNSWTGLTLIHGPHPAGPNAVDQYYHYTTRVNLREPVFDPDEPPVKYVIHSRYVNLCPELSCRKTSAENGGKEQNSAATSTQSKWRSCDVMETSESDDRRTVDCLSGSGFHFSDPELYLSGSGFHFSDPELYSSRVTVIGTPPPPPPPQAFDQNNIYHVSAV